MANDLTFNQISTILTEIMAQATGSKILAPVSTSEFVSVATTLLQQGYDPLLNSVSQVLSRTIFSIRPYYRKFGSLRVSNQRWGNITRKLNIGDKPFQDDVRFELVDGEAVDMYKVNKPNILQTNFYGANVYEKQAPSIFKDQLDNAFSGPDQLGEFMSLLMSNVTDMIEQAHENLARATVANFIGGKLVGDTTNVIHLLTEYNALTGLSLTAQSVYHPDNFVAFMQWVYSRIETLCELMTERTEMFHVNVTGKTLMRHTPKARQRAYLFSPLKAQIRDSVLSNTFNDNYLSLPENESVNFWQSIKTPMKLNVLPSYMDNTGTIITPATAVEEDAVFGVIFDEEAMGYTVVNEWSAPTPFNAKGGYSNIFFHFTDKFWNDFTENGIVLLLD